MPKQRYRRLTDLFVVGKPVALPDGSHLWVQAINSFERDEAISDAQVARARIILALRRDGAEHIKVEGRLAEMGHDVLANELARAQAERKSPDFAEEMRVDPDWKERMEIALRTDWDQAIKPPTEEELTLMAAINTEVLEEFVRRETEERDFLERKFTGFTDEELIEAWVDEWLERRGSDLATAEFRLTEVWYAARYCDAVRDPETGELSHEACEGHSEKVFETKAEARSAPQELIDILRAGLDDINLGGRDPKGSASPPSSSGSSPTASAPEESTPSTSVEAPPPAPGTSPSPSLTP